MQTDVSLIKLQTSFRHQVFEHNFNIQHRKTKALLSHKLHTHNFYEILLCCSDHVYFLINDVIYPLQVNDLLIFNDNDVHGLIADKDTIFERYVIEFDPKYVNHLCEGIDLLEYFHHTNENANYVVHLSLEQKQLLLSFINRLENFKDKNMYGIELYKKIALVEMILQVNIFLRENDRKKPYNESPYLNRIQNILSYINNNLSNDLSLLTLSKKFYISSSYLSNIFKNITGFTVNNYIINQRIIQATKLLKENIQVSQVAELCGFKNYAHFIRTFKKYEGISPKQYAKLNHKTEA